MSSLEIEKNVCLKKYNSWNVGGEAEYFCTPKNLEEMIEAEKFSIENNLSIRVLGSGSNVLIPDEGIRGLVICTKKFKEINVIKTEDHLKIDCSSGTPKFQLMKAFLQESLPPAIFLSGLPGDVGGGIVMNAGISEKIKPREFVDITDWFEVLHQGKIRRYDKQEVSWSYRHCKGWEPGMIVRAGFSYPMNEKKESIKERATQFAKSRKERQPLEMPSCGSTFVNPEGTSAGFLIEDSGLKGFQIGDAQVSHKHANFIVNLGNAKATDIKKLIEHIVEIVKQKHGIQLRTEVQFL